MKNIRSSKADTYWFAEEDSKKVVQNFIDDDTKTMSSVMANVWARNLYIYFSNVIKPTNLESGLNFTGNQGELVEMYVPMARSLTRQLVSIVTKQKLAFNLTADNTKSGTIQTARLGNSLVKDIILKNQMDVVYENMYEHSLLTGIAFLYRQWRTDKGEFYAKDAQGQDHFKGDLSITAPTVWDMRFDDTILDPRDWEWCRVRQIHNRWNLIAQFPQLKDQLLKIPSVRESNGLIFGINQVSAGNDDTVYVWAAYHIPCPALKEGRMLVYCSEDCVLVDRDNIYGELPVDVCRAEPLPGGSYGYPYFSNLIQVQEMLDNTFSTIATNHSTFGVQNVTVPRTANIESAQILGMNFILYTPSGESGAGRPEPLQLTQSAPEAYKFLDVLKSYCLDLSMINSALRGDPPTGVTSGAAIATLTTTALESVASSSKAARDCLRRCMLGGINTYKRMATVERSMDISGAGNQTYSKTFKGSDLDGIRGVDIVEMNPLMQTQMGRESQADKLLTNKMITNIKGYFAIMEGAPVSELYENELSQEDLVKRENEAMLSGEQVIVLNADDHAYHIMMHAMLLNDPKVRLTEGMSQGVLAHMLTHFDEAKKIDPFFAAMVATGKMPEGGMPQPAPIAPPNAAMPAGGGDPAQKASKPANPAQDLLGRQGAEKGAA